MHELKAATDILNIALAELAKIKGAAAVTDIYIVIGELSSYLDDSLCFYFAEIAQGTPAENAVLHFERIPAEFYCEKCGITYNKRGSDFTCQNCGQIGKLNRESACEFYIKEIQPTF